MTSSAEKLAARILGDQSAAAQRVVRGIVAGRPTAGQRVALELLSEQEPVPGTRNTLPHDPFAPPFSRPGADQAQYRAGHVPSAQLRRPAQVQGTTRARGANVWGSAPGQLGGVRPGTEPVT